MRLSKHLSHVEDITVINEAIATGDPSLMAHAISSVAWAHGVVNQTFTAEAHPTIEGFVKMLDVLGLELRVQSKGGGL